MSCLIKEFSDSFVRVGPIWSRANPLQEDTSEKVSHIFLIWARVAHGGKLFSVFVNNGSPEYRERGLYLASRVISFITFYLFFPISIAVTLIGLAALKNSESYFHILHNFSSNEIVKNPFGHIDQRNLAFHNSVMPGRLELTGGEEDFFSAQNRNVVPKILDYLSIQDLVNLSKVSKNCYNVVHNHTDKNNTNWKRVQEAWRKATQQV